MLQTGTLVAGKYKIIEKIGSGGMSTVYRAMDINLNKFWTVKEIIKSGRAENDRVYLNSLLAEANLIKKLDHPAIPRIVDIIDVNDSVFIVRDYIDGEPMDQILKNFGAQPQDSVVEWAKQLCDVLNYLHNNDPKIIYSDMKPANIMLVSDGSLRLIDFGIAKEEGKKSDTAKQCIGTRGFAPPEQFKKEKSTDERSDIYALGMTLYQLATGVSPAGAGFDRNKSVCEINSHYSSAFWKIIEKCIQENPDDRFQNCSEMRFALNRLNPGYRSHHETSIFDQRFFTCLPYAFLALSVVFWFVAIFCNENVIKEGVLFKYFNWTQNVVFNAKNLNYLLGIVAIACFGELRLRNRIKEMAHKIQDSGSLKGNKRNFVVSNVQEGSFFETIQARPNTASLNKTSDAGYPLSIQLNESDDRTDENDDENKSDAAPPLIRQKTNHKTFENEAETELISDKAEEFNSCNLNDDQITDVLKCDEDLVTEVVSFELENDRTDNVPETKVQSYRYIEPLSNDPLTEIMEDGIDEIYRQNLNSGIDINESSADDLGPETEIISEPIEEAEMENYKNEHITDFNWGIVIEEPVTEIISDDLSDTAYIEAGTEVLAESDTELLTELSQTELLSNQSDSSFSQQNKQEKTDASDSDMEGKFKVVFSEIVVHSDQTIPL